jgi:hypothetical protein
VGAGRSGGDAADWWRVDFQGQAGYVFARLLQPLTGSGAAKPSTGPTPTGRSGPDAAPARPGESPPKGAEPSRRGTVATDDNLPARLRARPTRESPILARVRAGDSVRLLGEAGGEAVGGGSNRWLKVQHGELVGWIWAPLIE